jgi:hypothetical protein
LLVECHGDTWFRDPVPPTRMLCSRVFSIYQGTKNTQEKRGVARQLVAMPQVHWLPHDDSWIVVLEEVRYTGPVTSNPGQESKHYGALHRFHRTRGLPRRPVLGWPFGTTWRKHTKTIVTQRDVHSLRVPCALVFDGNNKFVLWIMTWMGHTRKVTAMAGADADPTVATSDNEW